jgi:HPt (histidine-containing phosphotransfer) domain-containing protein
MTAHALQSEIPKCMQTGMNGVVTKPIDPDRLKEELLKWITPKHTPAAVPSQQAVALQPEVREDDSIDSLPGIDVKSALDRLRGNRRLLKKLVEDFVTNHSHIFADIREALERGDWISAQHAVHTFKGVAGNLSATQAFSSAARLETHLQQQDAAGIAEELEKMEEACQIVLKGITAARVEDKQNPQAVVAEYPVDIEIASGMISELSGLLRKHSMSAQRKWGLLKEIIYQAELKEPIVRFEECLNRLDFKSALKTLEEIAQKLGAELE